MMDGNGSDRTGGGSRPFHLQGRANGESPLTYLLGFLLAVVWVIAVSIVASLAFPLADAGGGPLSMDLSVLLPTLMVVGSLILFLVIAMRWMHRRPFGTLIGTRGGIRWGQAVCAALLWMAVVVMFTAVHAVLSGEVLGVDGFGLGRWVLYLLVLAPAVLIQVSAEELFFRGYLVQAAGTLTARLSLAAIPSALLFALAHAGADAMHGPLVYVVFVGLALFLSALCGAADRLEPAIGVHFAQNMFAFFIVGQGEADSVAPFQSADLTIGWVDVGGFAVMLAVFWYLGVRRDWIGLRRT